MGPSAAGVCPVPQSGPGPSRSDAPVAEGAAFSDALESMNAGSGTSPVPPQDSARRDTEQQEDASPGEPHPTLPLLPALPPIESPAARSAAADGEAAEGQFGMATKARQGCVPFAATAGGLSKGEAKPVPDMSSLGDSSQVLKGVRDALAQQAVQAGTGALREAASVAQPISSFEPVGGSSLTPASMNLSAATSASATTAPPAAQHAVRAGVGSARWASELGARLIVMSSRGQHEGSLTLSPEHLGPLEVRITVSQQTTHILFGAQQAETRAALAEALPRLREMFAEAGLSLGHAGISQEAPRQDTREADASRVSPHDEGGAESGETVRKAAHRIGSGLLDLYA